MLQNTSWRRETRDKRITNWGLRDEREKLLVSMSLDRVVNPDVRFDFAVYDPALRERVGLSEIYTVNHQGYMNAHEAGTFLSQLGLGPKRPHYLAEERHIQ